MNIINKPAANSSSRRGYQPTIVILHMTHGLMPGTLHWLTIPESKVSIHFLVTKAGEVYQCVNVSESAWHAGVVKNPSARAQKVLHKTAFGGWVNPNYTSIGIENEALEGDAWTEPQMTSLVTLIQDLATRPDIPFDGNPNNILSHQDVTSYKENMNSWHDEIIRRLSNSSQETDAVSEVKALLQRAITLLETQFGT
jgi:N-acetylmuramoyl-L-alanine amidase